VPVRFAVVVWQPIKNRLRVIGMVKVMIFIEDSTRKPATSVAEGMMDYNRPLPVQMRNFRIL
jgi:hypothetical protein